MSASSEEGIPGGAEKRKLRSLGQTLDARLRLGKAGVTPAFLTELNDALERFELVKVRFEHFKEEKEALIARMTEETHSHLIQRVGHTALLFRRNPEKLKR